MNATGREVLRQTFDTAAERYDQARPLYDSQIFDDLVVLADLEAGSRILEIGCGTGQATLPLAERGYRIVALDLGARLAEIARRKLVAHEDVEVVVGAFEAWPVPDEPFDAVVSANAFHWIDPTVRITKAADALRSSGSLVVIESWSRPIAPERVLDRLRGCYEQWTSDQAPALRPNQPDDESETVADIEASGLFEEIAVRTFTFTREHSTEQHHQLLLTFSNVLALDAERQVGLVGCIDEVVDRDLAGRFVETTGTRLVVARKK